MLLWHVTNEREREREGSRVTKVRKLRSYHHGVSQLSVAPVYLEYAPRFLF